MTLCLLQPEPWNDVLLHIEELLEILLTNKNILVSDNITDTSENVTDATNVSCRHSYPFQVQPIMVRVRLAKAFEEPYSK